MSHIKGLLKKEQLEDFKAFLLSKGIGWTIPKSPYAPLQVILPGGSAVLSINLHDVVGVPESLRSLVMDFLATPKPLTDTDRLMYLLENHRKVVVELVSSLQVGQRYEIFVESGFMGDREGPKVTMTVPTGESLRDYTVVLADKKRQAIDLAMANDI